MPHTHEHALLKPKAEEFLAYCGARNFSPNTIRAYRSDLDDFLAIIGQEATSAELDRKMMRRYITYLHDLGVMGASLQRKFASVKSFCKWLDGEGLLDVALIETVKPMRRSAKIT